MFPIYPVELHSHSTRSDGHDSVEQLIESAIKRGIVVLALTDHDTTPPETIDVDGKLVNTVNYARKKGLNLLPGNEISCDTLNEDVHIIALGCDWKDSFFADLEQMVRKSKVNSYRDVIEKIANTGINVSWQDLLEFSGLQNYPEGIQKKKLFEYLAEKGFAPDWSEAKKKLQRTPELNVAREKPNPECVITNIHRTGGHAILAHPYLISEKPFVKDQNDNQFSISRDEYIERLISAGLDGLEALYTYDKTSYKGDQDKTTIATLIINRYKDKVNVISAGSDYHADHKKGNSNPRKLGECGLSIESFVANKIFSKVLRKHHFLSYGEIMLRLKSPKGQRLLQYPMFEATFGGGEANVAVSLANYGNKSSYLTVLPENEIGRACISELKSFNVCTDDISFSEGRMGVYFVEPGSNQRPSKVVYDRKESSIAIAEAHTLNWDKVFYDKTWFHFTGITPALSQNAADSILMAVEKARQQNIIVSCDLNYRAKLWDYGKLPKEIMSEIMPFVDVCIANEEDIQLMLGLSADNHELLTDMNIDENQSNGISLYYKSLCKKVVETYPNVKTVSISLRESVNADINHWSACIYSGGKFHMSNKYKITDIIDRVGGGDSFAGALIHGLANMLLPDQALEFAVAASCLKHSIIGDFNRFSEQEVLNLVQGNHSGRIQR